MPEVTTDSETLSEALLALESTLFRFYGFMPPSILTASKLLSGTRLVVRVESDLNQLPDGSTTLSITASWRKP